MDRMTRVKVFGDRLIDAERFLCEWDEWTQWMGHYDSEQMDEERKKFIKYFLDMVEAEEKAHKETEQYYGSLIRIVEQ